MIFSKIMSSTNYIPFSEKPFYSINEIIPVVLLAFLVVFLSFLLVISRRQFKKAASRNLTLASLVGLIEMDFFVLDWKGRIVYGVKDSSIWKFTDKKPIPPPGFLHDEDSEKFITLFERLLDERTECISMECRGKSKSGTKYYVFKGIAVDYGLKRRIVCTVQDVTGTRHNEQHYRDTTLLLTTILDSISCPIFTKDISDDFRYMTSNKVFADQLPQNPVGKTDFDFMEKNDAEGLRQHDILTLEEKGKLFSFDEKYLCVDNSMYYCRTLKRVIELSDGKKVLLGISIDTTNETLAKLKLEDSEQRLRDTDILLQKIIDNAMCAIWLKEPSEQGRCLIANPYFHKLFGISDDNAQGIDVNNLPEHVRTLVCAGDSEALETEGTIFALEREFIVNDSISHVHIQKMTIQHGANRMLLGVALDITAFVETRKQLEKALEKAEESNRMKSFFLASVSHELRTPLNSIIGLSELMQDDEISHEARRKDLEAINFAGNMLLALINDILDLSKLEAARMEITPAKLETVGFCEKIADSFKGLFAEKNITLKMTRSSELPKCIIMDELRFRQIAFNLIGNAIKFTPADGIVGVSFEFVFDERNPGGGVLIFAVSDTGPGIMKKDIERIFEPFVQSSGGRDNCCIQAGTGLGLAISKKMVERMNGTIGVESEYGYGAKFIVRIPVCVVDLSGKEEIREKAEVQKKCVDLSEERIIIVDDVPMNLTVLGAMLKRLKAENVFKFTSAKEMLEQLHEIKPTLVFVDLWMPEMKGDELAAKIYREDGYENLPVIVITADIQINESDAFAGILHKPITLDAISNIIAQIV